MNRSTIGWVFVAAQAALLLALLVVPAEDDWGRPRWLWVIAGVLFVGGLALAAAASLRLGRSLTPTPVPVADGELITTGLYRYVRHPIYTGVLLVVVALVLRSSNWLGVVLGMATFGFFTAKASWEEQRLAETYSGYAEYARTTGRFVPRLRR